MARPKTKSAGLPPRVTVRQSAFGNLYYYQDKGRKVALGPDRRQAVRRARMLARGIASLEDARMGEIGMLTEDEIAAKAVALKRQPGIYFLLIGGKIAYIGQSADVFSRIRQHEGTRRFDAFCWFPCEPGKLETTESYLIAKFRPWQNKRFLEPI
jgi:hypothetical protein